MNFNIILLGPQGSGKGTQAVRLAQKFGLVHLEMGKIFRSLAGRPTPLGRRLNSLVNIQGKLVPDKLTNSILFDWLKKIKIGKGIVFDGYPRTLNQAQALEKLMRRLGRKIDLVIFMPISRKTSIRRLALRRVCQSCGRIFINGKDVKKSALTCPVCQGKLVQRTDDTPRAISRRLNSFRLNTAPIVSYFRRHSTLRVVNGEPSISQVAKQLTPVVKEVWSNLKRRMK